MSVTKRNIADILFHLLKGFLSGASLNLDYFKDINQNDWYAVIDFSQSQGMLALTFVGYRCLNALGIASTTSNRPDEIVWLIESNTKEI